MSTHWFKKDSWDEYYFVLTFPKLAFYKNKGDAKPVKTLPLQVADEGSDKEEEGPEEIGKIEKKKE